MSEQPTTNFFIHPENQTMLWNLLQESPYWKTFAVNMYETQAWFRGIISSMHELHPHVGTVEELRAVNSEVITICSKHMKAMSYSESGPVNNSEYSYAQQSSEMYNPEKLKEKRIAEAQANFDVFQERYNAGLAKPVPPVLNLSVNLDEPKITNMEELVKQHLESRNSLQLPAWDAVDNKEYSAQI